jgi:hypothetical protein
MRVNYREHGDRGEGTNEQVDARPTALAGADPRGEVNRSRLRGCAVERLHHSATELEADRPGIVGEQYSCPVAVGAAKPNAQHRVPYRFFASQRD